MERPVFIGDELSAAGFRLTGIHPVTPEADALAEVFDRALSDAPLVIITTRLANALPNTRLAEAVKRACPPVAVVPDATSSAPMPDMAQRVRLALGVEA